MITKGSAFSRAWAAYEKICVCEQPPYYHFQVGFRAAWLACTALKKAERRKTVRRKPPVQHTQLAIAAQELSDTFVAVVTSAPPKICSAMRKLNAALRQQAGA
jgi:nitrogen fixation/metabolism regulation signal transduction histidine kinase